MTAALFIAKHWKLLLGGLALATLGFMLMLAKADARHWHKLRLAAEQSLNLETAKHAVTRASLESALAAIDDMNTAVERLKTDGDARRDAAQKALRDATGRAQGAEAHAAALDASAAKSRPGESCKPSTAYTAVREEL